VFLLLCIAIGMQNKRKKAIKLIIILFIYY
jgi:hypothetical protein